MPIIRTMTGGIAATTNFAISRPFQRGAGWSIRVRKDGRILLSERLDIDFVEHVLPPQGVGDAFCLVLSQRALFIDTGNLEQTLADHHYAERTQRHPGSDLNIIHI